ncbi:MAG: TPM domain-containing protein [Bacteroidales bacterium]|nr:TPM domain-containing protein [Bacteroidales bacterium]
MVVFSAMSSFSQTEFPNPMNPPRLVNDFASFLSSDEIQSLEGKLRQFNNQTSTQIYTVVVKDLAGYAPSDYATRLAEKWGIGQKGKDNGILILVKPKTSNSKGEVYMSVGYGLEGVVPDAVANRIVDNEIIPAFKQGAYFQGLSKATDILISITRGEYSAEEYYSQAHAPKARKSPISIVILLIIVFSLFGGRSRMGRHSSVGRNLPFWLLLGMMGSGGNSHGGMFGDFSSGSGGFGGFGGGGGGSFGGGGAGGSW